MTSLEVWKPYRIPQYRNPSQQQLFADLSKKPSIGILGYTVKSTFTVGMKKSNPDHQILMIIWNTWKTDMLQEAHKLLQQTTKHWPKNYLFLCCCCINDRRGVQVKLIFSHWCGATRHFCHLIRATAASYCSICQSTTQIPHDIIKKMWLFKLLV